MMLCADVGHHGHIAPVLMLSKMSTAPFHYGEAFAGEGVELLFGNGDFLLKWFVDHEHAQQTIWLGRDRKLGLVGVVFALKRD